MSVIRYDLNACIGCQNCINVCPMDVFRFDYDANKSIIAYSENCQSCGQCYVGCLGRSLEISYNTIAYAIPTMRNVATDGATNDNVEAAMVAVDVANDTAEASGSSSGDSGWSH